MWHKAIKKLVCLSAIFFSSVFNNHTEALQYNKDFVQQLTKRQIKFGPQIGTGIFAGSLSLQLSIECKFVNWLGIQTGLVYFQNKYFVKSPKISISETLALVLSQ